MRQAVQKGPGDRMAILLLWSALLMASIEKERGMFRSPGGHRLCLNGNGVANHSCLQASFAGIWLCWASHPRGRIV